MAVSKEWGMAVKTKKFSSTAELLAAWDREFSTEGARRSPELKDFDGTPESAAADFAREILETENAAAAALTAVKFVG